MRLDLNDLPAILRHYIIHLKISNKCIKSSGEKFFLKFFFAVGCINVKSCTAPIFPIKLIVGLVHTESNFSQEVELTKK